MQQQKIVLMTGATSGIGLAAAIEFARQGAKIFAVGRNAERCASALRSIQEKVPFADVEFLLYDLSRQTDIEALCAEITQKTNVLDVIVHAAGLITDHYSETEDGLELQFAVNHMAPFLITKGLMSALKRSADARIVLITSLVQRFASLNFQDLQMSRHYSGLAQYARTKRCNVLFALEFNHRFRGSNVRAFVFDPGVVKTGIGLCGMSGVWRAACRFVIERGSQVDKTAEQICMLTDSSEARRGDRFFWKRAKPKNLILIACKRKAASRLWIASETLQRSSL